MKKLKYILFILPFLFIPNVFAKDVDVTSNCYGTTGYGSMYSGDEVQYQTYSNYNFGTTYQYQLSSFETELRYSLSANTDYTITFNTNNSNDFRNNFRTYNVYDLNNNSNNLVTGFTFVSMKKVQISFKTTTATNKVKIQMGGSNVYDNITGETNWNIKNAILTIPDTAPSGSTNQDVINNATNNTNNIINNNNQNTSDIINNANDNTITLNESINSACKDTTITIDSDLSMKSSYYISNTGAEVQYNGAYISKYIKIKPGATYTITRTTGGSQPSNVGYCRYNVNKALYMCASMPGENSSITFTADSYDAYLRVSFIGYRLVQVKGPICNNWEQEAQNETNQGVKDINDSINNSNVESGTGQGFFDNFSSQDFGLSQIITIPLNTIQSLTSKTCMPLVLPIPFTNETVSLPCMTEIYQNKLPSIYNLWKIVSFGIVAYFIAIDIFHIVKGFKDPESDKVEVLDL